MLNISFKHFYFGFAAIAAQQPLLSIGALCSALSQLYTFHFVNMYMGEIKTQRKVLRIQVIDARSEEQRQCMV